MAKKLYKFKAKTKVVKKDLISKHKFLNNRVYLIKLKESAPWYKIATKFGELSKVGYKELKESDFDRLSLLDNLSSYIDIFEYYENNIYTEDEAKEKRIYRKSNKLKKLTKEIIKEMSREELMERATIEGVNHSKALNSMGDNDIRNELLNKVVNKV